MTPLAGTAKHDRHRKRARRLGRILFRSGSVSVALNILLFWAVVAVAAPLLSPYDPTTIDFTASLDPSPSAAHWLGTDATGRDLLSRIIWGARTTFLVVPLSVLSAFAVGGVAGMVSAWFGGWTDTIIGRAGDVMLAFPALIVYIILITSFGPSMWNIVLAVTLAYAPGVARLMRAQVLSIKSLEYVLAARAAGEGPLYIMFVEILPNVGTPLIVDLCLRTGYAVILVGTLGFLGLGLPPPTPDWGGMVVEGVNLLTLYPHISLFPAAAVTSVVIACNLLADGLRGLRR
ncbi:MAG: ABC transporter permease [Rhodobacteraceae bacterium]|nr:ABC transporter permease [Paracoccaceae bacterium]